MGIKETAISAISAAAGQVMTGLDGLFTSDDERNESRIKVEQIFNNLTTSVLSHIEAQEKERSARHAADMNSDSWLSKNIRPLTLIYLLVLFTGIVITDSIVSVKFTVAPHYVDLLKTLLLAVFSFYFVARGIEKVTQSIKAMKTTKIELQ